MTPRHSAVGTLIGWSWFSRFRNRALAFVAAIAICLVLTVFPQRYEAEALLAPTDPSSLGLSGTLGQLGALGNVFGNQAAIEVALRVADSVEVRQFVIKDLHLEQRTNKTPLQLQRWLRRRIDIRSLRGGIVQVDVDNTDPQLAQDIVSSFVGSLQHRLGEISRIQTSYKRDILMKLVREASDGLVRTQANYDSYRLQHQEAVPELQTGSVAGRIAQLESGIKGKAIALSLARQMYTDDNVITKQIIAETQAMQTQLAEAKATNPQSTQSVGSVVASTSKLFQLQRELTLQRTLYDSYMRFLQGTAVEDLTSTANMRVLEPPHINPERQYWFPAMAVATALVVLWATIEFYRLRPPVGAPIAGAEPQVIRRERGLPDELDHG
ncbi:hypothetical protein [Novosphingobium acidiphilum]|uniref:hypothetical protein n=1 Tax=Novosphingobium acidiphilum TaxID=505248 RepID=UPI00048E719D|nr:hypothetical protein [Novosphingobium acidiphilum]